MSFFQVEGLGKRFGGLAALEEVSLSLNQGEIHGVIGPNGAGKTTFFSVVSGFYKPTAGRIIFEDKEITGRSPSSIAKLGLVRTFQRVAMFPKFTVLENISVSRHLHAEESLFGAIFGTAAKMENDAEERAREIAEFLKLGSVMNEPAMNLSHGHQRILNMAMAMAAEPKLLLLDEPVAGMNAAEKDLMVELIRKIRDEWKISILLVEHDMRTVMGLCEHITVLNFGKKLAEGTPDEIKNNHEVIDAYLGTG